MIKSTEILREIVEKMFNVYKNYLNTTTAEQEEKARGYGEAGSKQVMSENMKKKGHFFRTLLIGGLILLFIKPLWGVAVLAVFIVLYMLNMQNEKATGTDAKTLYRVNFLNPALDKNFPEGYKYEHSGFLSDNAVLSAMPDMRLTPPDQFISGWDLFSFTFHGIPMSFSHNTCKISTENTNVSKMPWEGEVYEASYKTRIQGYVRIVPTTTHLGIESVGDYMKLKKGREVKVETDNIYFNEHFDVFATSEQDAFFVLNPVVINYFADTSKASKGKGQSLFVSGDTFVMTCEGVYYDVFKTPNNLEEVDALSVEGKCRECAEIAETCYEMLKAIDGSKALA